MCRCWRGRGRRSVSTQALLPPEARVGSLHNERQRPLRETSQSIRTLIHRGEESGEGEDEHEPVSVFELQLHFSSHIRSDTHRSAQRTLISPLFTHSAGRHARMARGNTYNAISPLRCPRSIQMLEPQIKLPTKVHPKGPSQKSCGIHGNRRARASVRVRQTAYQMEETNAERKEALLATESRVDTKRGTSSSLRGLVRRMGKKWTLHSCQHGRLPAQACEGSYRQIEQNTLSERLCTTDACIGCAASASDPAMHELAWNAAQAVSASDRQCLPDLGSLRSSIGRQLSRISPCRWIAKVPRIGGENIRGYTDTSLV